MAALEVSKLGYAVVKEEERARRWVTTYQDGLQLGLRDLSQHKAAYDTALLQSNHAVSWYLISLDHASEIVCTVGFSPEVDFHGNRLQAIDSTAYLDVLTCSIIKTASGSVIVFAWLSERNEACSRFVNSLDQLKDHLLPSAVLRMVFEHGENVFFRPSWWNSLDETTKAKIEARANSLYDKPDECLKDDGCRPVLWSIVGREKRVRSGQTT